MKTIALAILLCIAAAGCGDNDQAAPTCAELGCPKVAFCNHDATECYCDGEACLPDGPVEDAAPADANCAAVLRTCHCTADGLEDCGLGDLQWGCGCYPQDAGVDAAAFTLEPPGPPPSCPIGVCGPDGGP